MPRPSMWMLLWLFCCAIGSAATARGAAAPTLTVLETRHRAHLLAARPDLASRYGFGGEDRLEPVTETSIAHDSGWLRNFTADLARVDVARLSPRARTRLDSLRVRTEREAAAIDAGLWRLEPLAYLALVHDAVLEVNRAPHVSACERCRRTLERLRLVPEVLRAALVNLRECPAPPTTTFAAFDSAAAQLRTAIFAPIDGCKDPRRQADVVAADTLALHAYVRFLTDLRATPAAKDGR